MKLNPKQLAALIKLAVSVEPDALGCDGCAELMAQLAQAELDGAALSEPLQLVRRHIAQCKCCRDEYAALVTALQALGD